MKQWRRLLYCSMLLVTMQAPARADAPGIDIEIRGLDKQTQQHVLPLLTLQQERADPGLTAARIRTLHARAARELQRALEPLGYYRATIESTLREGDSGWRALYTVAPGPPLPVTGLDLQLRGEARDDEEFRKLIDTFPVRVGERLQHAHYEEGKRALLNLAAERGYFDAKLVRHEIRLDLEHYRAEVVLELDAGARYRFGAVSFEQDYFERAFLERFVPFTRGEGYRNSAVLQLQTALANSDYFERVEVRPRRDLMQDREVPIEVTLTLRPENKYTFGVGYGTDTGARGKVGWERRLINPQGHRFGTEFELSEIRSSLRARYRIPVSDPRTDELVFNASYTDDHPLTSDSTISKFGASLNGSRGIFRESLSLNYHAEEFTTGTDKGRTLLVLPGASWEYLSTLDRLHPRQGGRAQFELRGASVTLGSDVSFLQARLGGKLIQPMGDNGRWIARVDTGYMRTHEFENVPASFRFYAGGSQSVRGYRYQSLGPRDSEGNVTGGRYLAVGGLEYDHRIVGNWGAALFYDVGKAFNDSEERSSAGTGIGVRWRLPIGTARLDFAHPLDTERDSWRIHFSIGPDL